jgi:hypothetical protein
LSGSLRIFTKKSRSDLRPAQPHFDGRGNKNKLARAVHDAQFVGKA